MSINFKEFESKIKQCFLSLDINYFIEDLSQLFSVERLKFMNDTDRTERVDVFLMEFQNLKNDDKYTLLKNSAETHNKWIHSFLSVDVNDREAVFELNAKWIVLENLLGLLRLSKDSLCVMDAPFINSFYSKEVITKANRDSLNKCLEHYGSETTLFEFFNVVSAKDHNWYGRFLYIVSRQKTAFMKIIDDELEREKCDGTDETLYRDYANKVIERHITDLRLKYFEKGQSVELGIKDVDYDGETSDYMSHISDSTDGDREAESFSLSDDENSVEEIERVELKLKSFQLELSELALKGENVIIYAPTGTGKTVVAVHIANKHLESNPNGKVAFLVPRTPLVTQQYRMFKKFMDGNFLIIEMRGKSETITGPLIAHYDNHSIFVMTSDILRNALTVDDGNKLSSICQFSLIFFDECHNCMKSHPYTKIMKEYFKEKRDNPSAKLPQIVGLTASPRSNKKDDIVGMQKSLFELCANLDCSNFSMVKQNMDGLEEYMSQPKQEVMKIGQRKFDEFETTLLQVMTKCETKLAKMRGEGYFPSSYLKMIPNNKFVEDYIGFVGNLEKLNTVTSSDNDGKQKAYCIYRYLNAYYRGLIVNQLFDEHYARLTIAKYLKHNGQDFTCCYDEEFYNSYTSDITILQQSENPSIEVIKSLILKQLESKPESRILIFVRQVDYTYYLVDILKNNNVDAEAIVGSNTKNNLKGCTINEMNEILRRFIKGDTKVLVATTVVEEGLDVGLCNMVISYGHVTNETALIQRRGRARSADSRYILVLPPMLAWLERKEGLNERRKELMMNLISKFGQMNFQKTNMNLFIMDYQHKNLFIDKKAATVANVNKASWNFKCKKCQELICTSEELRIVENMHRVCINPKILTTFVICKRDIQSFGSQGNYEIGGVVKCKCQNSDLANFMLYRKIPYFQLTLSACNVESTDPSKKIEHSLKKWKDFAKHYTIPDLSKEELQKYCLEVNDLDI